MYRITAFCVVIGLGMLSACTAGSSSYTPFINAEPEIGAVAERRPRNLRLYFTALPDVSRSNLTLVGPDGEYALRGLHTMGADDLMVEITNPAIPDGNYTVTWSTVVEGDPNTYNGSFEFTVAGN